MLLSDQRRTSSTEFAADAEVSSLLGESIAATRVRESSALTEALRGCQGVVLVGAGNLGRMLCAALQADGLAPLAFVDNNPTLWGSTVCEVPVLPPQEAANRFGTTALFVVSIWGLTVQQRFDVLAEQLKGLGVKRVVPPLPALWRYGSQLLPFWSLSLPSALLENAHELRRVYDLLADRRSREIFLEHLRFRLTGDPRHIGDPEAGLQYLRPEIMQLTPDEVIVDCGAYDGDTLKDWLSLVGRFEQWVALEPDPQNRLALTATIEELAPTVAARVVSLPFAVADSCGEVVFSASGTPGSSLAGAVPGQGISVRCVRLDDLVAEQGLQWPTFVKMDIEGAETSALVGATELLRRRPVLAVAVYHRWSDLWEVPLSIERSCPDYSYYLRMHGEQGWDLVCYAVPAERAADGDHGSEAGS